MVSATYCITNLFHMLHTSDTYEYRKHSYIIRVYVGVRNLIPSSDFDYC